MSFAIIAVGTVEEARGQIADTTDKRYGGKLEDLTRTFLAEVLALEGSPKVIVEASGHSDDRMTNVAVSVRPVLS